MDLRTAAGSGGITDLALRNTGGVRSTIDGIVNGPKCAKSSQRYCLTPVEVKPDPIGLHTPKSHRMSGDKPSRSAKLGVPLASHTGELPHSCHGGGPPPTVGQARGEYYREVFGGEMSDACEFSSFDEANEILGLMMRHWNTYWTRTEWLMVTTHRFDLFKDEVYCFCFSPAVRDPAGSNAQSPNSSIVHSAASLREPVSSTLTTNSRRPYRHHRHLLFLVSLREPAADVLLREDRPGLWLPMATFGHLSRS